MMFALFTNGIVVDGQASKKRRGLFACLSCIVWTDFFCGIFWWAANFKFEDEIEYVK